MIVIYDTDSADAYQIPDTPANRRLLERHSKEVGTPRGSDWTATSELEKLTKPLDKSKLLECSAFMFVCLGW